MKFIRPDPIGFFDILVGVMIIYTSSPLPSMLLDIHATILIFKGALTLFRGLPPVMPIFVLGVFADMISAAILLTGTPPILADYKTWVAGFLFLKGALGVPALL